MVQATVRKFGDAKIPPPSPVKPIAVVVGVPVAYPKKPPSKRWRLSCLKYLGSVRLRMCLVLCGAMFIMQFMNMSLGMTIICMVETNMTIALEGHPDNMTTLQAERADDDELAHLNNVTIFSINEGAIQWGPTIQGLVLSSLSWGRLLTPAAGLLADRFNVKILMSVGIAVAGLSTALIPFSSSIDYTLVIFWRLVTGLADSVVQPSTNRLIPIWFPVSERNLALSIMTGGRQLAVVSVYPLAGYFCQKKDVLGGWPLVFYFASVLTIIWLPVFIFWANQNPQKHRTIRQSEKEKIAQGTGAQMDAKPLRGHVPWKSLVTSGALWANIGAVLCHEIPLVVVFVFLPSYLRDVLHFEIKDIGILSGIPAAAFLCAKLASGQIADVLLRRLPKQRYKSIVAKIFNSVASAGLGTCLIAITMEGCVHRIRALGLMIGAIAFAGLHTPGCLSALVTIAPSYTGTVSGMTFFLVGIAALLNPLLVKAIVRTGSRHEWAIVFQAAGAIALIPIIFFNIWGSADLQPWGKLKHAPSSSSLPSSHSNRKKADDAEKTGPSETAIEKV